MAEEARADEAERARAEAIRSHLEAIIESSSDAIIGKTVGGVITSWNRGAEVMYGYSAGEVLGRHVSLLVPPDRKGEDGELIRLIREGGVARCETIRVRKDGTRLEVSLAVSPIRGASGEIAGVATIARDVSERKRVEQELRAASAYARSLIEASLDPLVTISPAGKITDVNRATEEATGVARRELVGTDFADYFTRPEEAHAGYQRVLARGLVRDYPLTLRHRSGRTIDVLYNASVYRNERGELQGVFAAARDITERNRAEKELRAKSWYARNLIEASLDPLVTISPEGKITDVNRATEEVTGVGRERLVGTDFADYFTDPAQARAGYEQVLATGYVRDFPLTIRHASGRRRDVLYNATVYRDEEGRLQGVFAAARDVTERKRAEDEIRRLNAGLELRVAERTAELEGANQELEGFAYSVSHDLRAPLRAIDGFSRILLEDYEARLDAEGKRLLHVVRDNTARMAQLIDDILAFSRVGRAGMSMAAVDMNALVAAVFDELRQTAGEREVVLELGALPRARGDRAMIRQVLVNLLANALKFTQPRARAVIAVEGRREGDLALYAVRDNGVGFDMRYAAKLFGVFQRLHGSDEFEGTGIGLAIVKRIVARHGGEVSAESGQGEGATFRFSLPHGEAA